jgi:uncharacterized transporter YbjL
MLKRNQIGKITYNAILYLCCFSVGIVTGKLFNFSYFKIDEKLNLVNILSIAATIFSAWYLANILDREKQRSKSEKELILGRISDLNKLLDNSLEKVEQGEIEYVEAASVFKRLNTTIENIYILTGKLIAVSA